MDFFDIFLGAAYVLVAVAALGAIILPLISALSNPKSLIKSGAGILALGAIFLISWAVAGNEVTPIYTKFDITSTSSQVIGGVLITTYVLLFVAVISIVFTEISKLVK